MVPNRKRTGRIPGVLLVALLVVPAALAEKTEKSDADRSESPYAQATRGKSSAPTRSENVYTTDDLERLYADKHGKSKAKRGTAEPQKGDAAPKTPAVGDDPLSRLQQQQTEQAERMRLIVETKQKVADAKKRVRELQQRILATKNPLLARPRIPEEERAEWSGQGAAQRVRNSEDKLRLAREELEKAKANLTRLRAGN